MTRGRYAIAVISIALAAINSLHVVVLDAENCNICQGDCFVRSEPNAYCYIIVQRALVLFLT